MSTFARRGFYAAASAVCLAAAAFIVAIATVGLPVSDWWALPALAVGLAAAETIRRLHPDPEEGHLS